MPSGIHLENKELDILGKTKKEKTSFKSYFVICDTK